MTEVLGQQLVEALQHHYADTHTLTEGRTEQLRRTLEANMDLQNAQKGDTHSMVAVGNWYGEESDLPNADKLAYDWYSKSTSTESKPAHPQGLHWKGTSLLHGKGVQQNTLEGIFLMQVAAGEGCVGSCIDLSSFLLHEHHGMSNKKKMAEYYFDLGMIHAAQVCEHCNHDPDTHYCCPNSDERIRDLHRLLKENKN